jgi:outer membrane receptor protein involved in Fe transport
MRDKKWVRLLAYVTGLIKQRLLLQNEHLIAENRILRSHLPSRLRLSDPERSTLAEIGKRVGRRAQTVWDAAETRKRAQLLTLSPLVAIRDPLTSQPFPGNILPANRLSAVSLKVQDQQMPRPNLGAADLLVNNFEWVHPYPSDQFRADVLVTRIDHHFSPSNSFHTRFSAYLPRYITPGNYPTTASSSRRQSHSWVFVDTHIFSPSMINTFTFGGNRDGRDVGIEINGYQPPQGAQAVADLGLQGLSTKVQSFTEKESGYPVMNITGYSPITVAQGGRGDPRSFTFADAITRSSPRHVLKFGGELRTYRDFNGYVPESTYGRFAFNGSLSNNAYSDFLLGLPFQSERLDPIVDRTRNSSELGLFVTDTFKVNSRLNLDIGLRWDYYTSTTFEDAQEASTTTLRR